MDNTKAFETEANACNTGNNGLASSIADGQNVRANSYNSGKHGKAYAKADQLSERANNPATASATNVADGQTVVANPPDAVYFTGGW